MDEITENTRATKLYYHDLGRGHDYLLRCKDCKKLITYDSISEAGGCKHCGNKRVTEITSLTLWEWLKVRLGIIRFPDRSLFLQEFSPWRRKNVSR